MGYAIHAARSEFGALHILEHAPRSSPGTALCRLARQDDKIVVRCGVSGVDRIGAFGPFRLVRREIRV